MVLRAPAQRRVFSQRIIGFLNTDFLCFWLNLNRAAAFVFDDVPHCLQCGMKSAKSMSFPHPNYDFCLFNWKSEQEFEELGARAVWIENLIA